ncbi:hypothetical protein [aff. Roholtiella sp. LEGE 12411]|uniref:hypothetical protein n=1 Tax=aff. Roholtiella sp. LEGE 12411 TaxID=1828822 RepID=UPI00187FA3C2|nr:hypothetical protein [aff. Roholtiella sp. LEGE 12411]MBE9038481.1 hypothetical protein [aff. Roholtiella sp. LEGE 12411]
MITSSDRPNLAGGQRSPVLLPRNTMSLPLNQSVLLESRTLRTSALKDFSGDKALSILQQDVYVYPCHDPVVAAGLTKAIEEFFAHL